MSEIKIGARVRVDKCEVPFTDVPQERLTGSVIDIVACTCVRVCVQFDFTHRQLHDRGGRGLENSCWWVDSDNIHILGDV